jgi:hypothetical protein
VRCAKRRLSAHWLSIDVRVGLRGSGGQAARAELPDGLGFVLGHVVAAAGRGDTCVLAQLEGLGRGEPELVSKVYDSHVRSLPQVRRNPRHPK